LAAAFRLDGPHEGVDMSARVLVITSNHGDLGGKPNGTYLPELTHALHGLENAGLDYDLASPRGGEIPGYGHDADELTRTMLASPTFAARLRSTLRLAEVDPSAYAAVFFPGGYGLLFDLTEDADSQRLTASFFERGAPVAAVCHGPAALSRVRRADGTSILAGRDVTGFTREEEVAMQTLDVIPFVLEERMLEVGAVYRKKAAWQVLIVEDGNLITGQNPASAAGVGEALVRALAQRAG
jgi:putative intracellular protease/amidase